MAWLLGVAMLALQPAHAAPKQASKARKTAKGGAKAKSKSPAVLARPRKSAALEVPPGMGREDLEDETPLGVPATPPKPKAPDPRALLGPQAVRLAPATSVPRRALVEPRRADGLAFTCRAAGVVDVETGALLYGRNLTQRMAPASLTKIMTTLLALEDIQAGRARLTDLVVTSKEGAHTAESGLWLQVGEKLSLQELLIGVMVRSANDASYLVAEHLGGGDPALFVERMNNRARELGALDTHFVNPHGLHMGLDGNAAEGREHWTTPYDLLLFTSECWKFPLFRQLCLMDGEPVRWENMDPDPAKKHPPYRIIHNRNKLLRRYDECVGVKTGFTKQAGACLVSAALRADRAVLAVTMHSASGDDRWRESEALLRWGLDEFERREIVKAGDAVVNIPVAGGRSAQVGAVTTGGLVMVVPKAAGEPRVSPNVTSRLAAPFVAGLPVGTLDISVGADDVRRVALVAQEGVERAGLRLGPWAPVCAFWLVLIGVVAYGAAAEAHRRRGLVLATSRGGADPRRPGEGQWPGGAGAGYEGERRRPD